MDESPRVANINLEICKVFGIDPNCAKVTITLESKKLPRIVVERIAVNAPSERIVESFTLVPDDKAAAI